MRRRDGCFTYRIARGSVLPKQRKLSSSISTMENPGGEPVRKNAKERKIRINSHCLPCKDKKVFMVSGIYRKYLYYPLLFLLCKEATGGSVRHSSGENRQAAYPRAEQKRPVNSGRKNEIRKYTPANAFDTRQKPVSSA